MIITRPCEELEDDDDNFKHFMDNFKRMNEIEKSNLDNKDHDQLSPIREDVG
jgi:hypothetical protein